MSTASWPKHCGRFDQVLLAGIAISLIAAAAAGSTSNGWAKQLDAQVSQAPLGDPSAGV